MSNKFAMPFAQINDIDGSPLDAGFVFIGESGKDAELFPINAYWDKENTILVNQPIRTRNGYFSNNGEQGAIFIQEEECSIKIKNQFSTLISHDLHSTLPVAIGDLTTSIVKEGDKTQDVINAEKADKYGFRWKAGGTGSETAVNTILAYAGNAISNGIRGAHVQQGSQLNENIIGGNPSTVGLAVPNVVDNSKTYNAHYAIVGGYDNVNNVLAGFVVAYHCKALDDGTGIAGATHATIVGGSYHSFIDGDYSSCVGGTLNTLDYKDGGSYSFFGAGGNGNIYGKYDTIIASFNGRIGTSAAIPANWSAMISSDTSTIDGNFASIISGDRCKATKNYSHATGKYAVANNVGERAFSTGRFLTDGDSGQSVMHLMRKTSDAVQTQLVCSDVTSDTIVAMGLKTSLYLKAVITAYNTTTNAMAAFEIVAHLSRDTGNAVLNAHIVTPIYNPDNLAVAIVPSTTLYQVRVTGLAANNINWTCRLETVWARNI
ncbi:hypothetical protein [Acinetobacter dispersus]|uniref:hypothetical protein n=1 Tax=Acinetobacter dispersus TaxID=70348 RepID=UPI001F4B5B6B|nr:hypothetical protein [Acinetobacter dispersus]MCH7391808.1 hypothetical protein [Acinetobacter dispersus]